MRQKPSLLGVVALIVTTGTGLTPRSADADVSSWFYVGGGAAELSQSGTPPLLQVDTGLGSSPDAAFIVGGLGRIHALFGDGIDLGLSLRTTHHAFVVGDWGAAVDVGGYQRWWGQGSTGGSLSLVLGAPWGITAALGGALGTNDARTLSFTVGIDFARLTVHRQTGLGWFPSPQPFDAAAE